MSVEPDDTTFAHSRTAQSLEPKPRQVLWTLERHEEQLRLELLYHEINGRTELQIFGRSDQSFERRLCADRVGALTVAIELCAHYEREGWTVTGVAP